jgi:hypothetical protein
MSKIKAIIQNKLYIFLLNIVAPFVFYNTASKFKNDAKLFVEPQYMVNVLKSPFIPKGHIQYAPTKRGNLTIPP